MNRPKTDRGQLILATGFTIAVVLVALVVLLNTVIYTENLATRGVDAGGADAIEYRATVIGAVGELIAEENAHYDEGDWPVEGVENGTGMIVETLSERHLIRGAIAETTYEINEGQPISWQIESQTFAENGSNATVATDVIDTTQFALTVESVEPATDPQDRFRLVVGDWVMTITVEEAKTDGEGEQIMITTETDGESWTYNHPSSEDPLEIDLRSKTINDKSASLDTPLESDEVRYENADRLSGSYDFQATGPDTVESVDLAIHYETAELRYITEATVTAGEST